MIRFLNGAKRAIDIARRLSREVLPPSLLAKLDRRFGRIIAVGKDIYVGLQFFEPARAGKRGRKEHRVAEKFLRRLMRRKKVTLPLLYDLSVPSRTTRPNAMSG